MVIPPCFEPLKKYNKKFRIGLIEGIMKNLGKRILLGGAILLIIYGIILSGIGLLVSEDLGLMWWFARISIFLTIFSTVLLLGLYFLPVEK